MELVESLWPRFGKFWVEETQRLRSRLGGYQDLAVLAGLPHRIGRSPIGAQGLLQ